MTAARDNLDALTGLRFVAAFTIVLGHTYMPWLEVTAIGMPLFFTLSGFIIHYVYADDFAGGWRPASRKFAVARFSRIYPLYLALLCYSVLRGPMGPPLMTPEGLPVLLAYLTGCWTWWYRTTLCGLPKPTNAAARRASNTTAIRACSTKPYPTGFITISETANSRM